MALTTIAAAPNLLISVSNLKWHICLGDVKSPDKHVCAKYLNEIWSSEKDQQKYFVVTMRKIF